MIVWYLYIAVMLQTGHPDLTFAKPYPTEQACTAAKVEADAVLAAEALEKDDANSAQAITFCKAVEFAKPEHHVPAKDEA